MIIERPVVNLLTFQVWDPSYMLPGTDYAWTGTPNASASTRTTQGSVRTNLVRDPNGTNVLTWGTRTNIASQTPSRSPLTGATAMLYTTTAAAASEKFQSSSGTNRPPVIAGLTYQGGIRLESPSAPTTARAVIDWYTDTSYISSTYGPTSVVPTGGAATLSVVGTAPANATRVDGYFDITAGASGATGYLRQGYIGAPGDYFDGDTPDVPAVSGRWRDLAGQATALKIVRGGDLSGAATSMQVGTLDATLLGVTALASDPALRPNSPIRVVRADGRPEFTGTIADIDQDVDYDKSANEKTVWTTIAAVDAVQSLANTDRFGAVADSGTGRQSWTERLNQLETSALVPMNVPDSGDVEVYGLYDETTDGWSGTNASSSGNVQFTLTSTYGPGLRARVNRVAAGAALVAPRVTRQFRNLDTSSTYAFAATVTLAESVLYTSGAFVLVCYGDSGTVVAQSDPFTFTGVGDSYRIGVQFQVPGQVATVGLAPVNAGMFASDAGTATVAIDLTGIRVTRVGDPNGYQLQDVAYEASLLDHIDLACNTVGGRWWVDKGGVVQFARKLDGTTPSILFGDTDAADVSYTDLQLRYDTRNVVNALRINQHGRDPISGDADDATLALESGSSIRRWGIRSSTVDTCLYTGPGHEQDALRRGREVMAPLARPRYMVNTFTINAQSAPFILAALELRALIQVDYEDLTQTCRVLKLTHTITPTRWTVQVDVSDVRSAPSFADFNAVTPGTFAAFNAAHPGTFADFTADPIRETS